MQPRTVVPALVLVVVLAVPTATAALVLEAESMQSTGAATWTGPLLGIARTHPTEALLPTFAMTAESLNLQTDSANPAIYSPAGRLQLDAQASPYEAHEAVTVAGLQTRPGARWIVLPDGTDDRPTAALEGSCVDARPAGQSAVFHDPRVYPDRGPLVIDAGQGTTLEPCHEATLTITGAFLLVLWEWDIQLASDGGTRTLWSGSGRSYHDPVGSEETQSVIGEDRELFLHVHNGNLTVRLQPGESVVVGHAAADVTGSLRLHRARVLDGLPNPTPQVVQEVHVEGTLSTATQRTGDTLFVAVGGTLEGVTVDGQTVALPAPGVVVWPWVAALVLATVAFGVWAWFCYAYPLRVQVRASRQRPVPWMHPPATRAERRALGWFVLARAAWLGGRVGLAGFYAGLAVVAAGNRVEGRWMLALVHARRRRWRLQLRQHESIHFLTGGAERARNAAWAAKACRRLGRLEAARVWRARAGRHAFVPGLSDLEGSGVVGAVSPGLA